MLTKRNYKDSKNALILTGGGARAAYQVGVLSAISKFVPRNHGIPFPIICGTSAGAINTTALACYSSCFHLGVKKLEWVWKNINTSRVYHSDGIRVFSHLAKGMLASFQADYANKSARSLLNNAPLRDMLNMVVDFKRIDANIIRGYLSAVSITASSYSNGDSISFYQSEESISPWFRAKRRGEPCQINSEHLMASAAIPLVFPSIKIRQEHYGDGSIHQLSPLSPAIHLGGENLFIIGVDQPKAPLHSKVNNPHPPTTSTVAGHLLDTIFSDTLHSDIERLERINETIKLIPPEVRKEKDGLKPISSFLINPSHDFNAIAVDYFSDLPLSIRLLLRSVGISNDSESSIVSYLLFEKNYCRQLIKLGFEDAMEQETAIRKFLSL
ncbi:MAG: patatin-like phospholipase family protein [Colwellia sp.]|jgi:NTE family protein|uniref:patatin-like phospholipase family protein n=1 Tax=Colwellia sp. Bg11-12 TaxID=2759817 RepID=UPI0015F38A98|nr:patatin-like phospholipase family protein [Colwellia sp. Bg11-12]MBA6265509.1 patatin-like phospholipase family protein [Colwellia sp. Bg11-12]